VVVVVAVVAAALVEGDWGAEGSGVGPGDPSTSSCLAGLECSNLGRERWRLGPRGSSCSASNTSVSVNTGDAGLVEESGISNTGLSMERWQTGRKQKLAETFLGAAVAQEVRAVVWQKEGCWFDPRAPPPS